VKSEAQPYHFLAADAAPARGTATVAVTDALREAIATLKMKPGEVIDKGAVCARLGVSRFPVSEALSRLQAEGLVDIQPQRGSVVSLVRIADVRENMLIRRALESEAVRIVAERLDPGLAAALRANLAMQREAAEADRPDDFHRHDLAFHAILFDALRLPRVKAAVDGTRANLDRARRLVADPRRLADTIAEHEAIVAAIEAGDPVAAAEAMRRHLGAVVEEVAAFAKSNPKLFADGAES
jgi:DNA-binding GntR family transcriptional regulator